LMSEERKSLQNRRDNRQQATGNRGLGLKINKKSKKLWIK
jgi:hypothetical protein